MSEVADTPQFDDEPSHQAEAVRVPRWIIEQGKDFASRGTNSFFNEAVVELELGHSLAELIAAFDEKFALNDDSPVIQAQIAEVTEWLRSVTSTEGLTTE